jgi:hypothetical protein
MSSTQVELTGTPGCRFRGSGQIDPTRHLYQVYSRCVQRVHTDQMHLERRVYIVELTGCNGSKEGLTFTGQILASSVVVSTV